MIDRYEMLETAKACGIKFGPAQFSGVLEAEVSEFDLEAYTLAVMQKAKSAEREECAGICDVQSDRALTPQGAMRSLSCARRIRARGTGGEG